MRGEKVKRTHLINALNWLILPSSFVLDTIKLLHDPSENCGHSPSLLEVG